MTAAGSYRRPEPPAGVPQPRLMPWLAVPIASAALRCEHVHGAAGGRLDETARRLSHEELAAARLLVGDGHDVRSLAESRQGGRRPDLLVCADTVEVKSFAPLAERRRLPTAQSVFNKLVDAGGQAPHAVLMAQGSGLSVTAARQGVARYAAAAGPTALSSVRIVGDGYDLSWARRPTLELDRARLAPSVGRSPQRDTGVGIGI